MGTRRMNRWRQRLAELQDEAYSIWHDVQNTQIIQNRAQTSAFEHFEQIEHGATSAAASAASTKWGEAEAERAAIIEYDDDVPRAWAEGFARLDPNRPPRSVPPRRWLQFVDDVGNFLNGPFCGLASTLGWGPYDLFGCDRNRPFARIDQAGLLWLLSGDRLFALSENTATVETGTGARQTYRRKPHEPGRVLPWELTR
jgi:hypothetical protein